MLLFRVEEFNEFANINSNDNNFVGRPIDTSIIGGHSDRLCSVYQGKAK